MSLHVETLGSGTPLVMLHGWGMHGGVWSNVVQELAADFLVHNVDLPGHGASAVPDVFTLDTVVEQLAATFGQPVTLCGWSLGGIIAQHWAAREQEKVQRLILVNSTPCFATRVDWIFGMPLDTLSQFATELEKNHVATLRRFLALQVRGSEGERELLAVLREKLFSHGEPHLDALRGGLAILRDADLRGTLQQIRQPTLVVAGERDKLTPPEASHYLAQSMPHARKVVVSGAAHAPFLSHPDVFVGQVRNFLKDN